MFIKVDYRESDLLMTMNLLFKEHSHEIHTENLPIGDIILYDNEKYYLVAGWGSDGGYTASFKTKNKIHILEYMFTRTNNIIFDIERGS